MSDCHAGLQKRLGVVRAYLLHRVTPQRLEVEAPMEVWQACLARAGGGSAAARSSSAWINEVLKGAVGTKAGPHRLELPRPDIGGSLAVRSAARVERSEQCGAGAKSVKVGGA
eukprot:g9960.t1